VNSEMTQPVVKMEDVTKIYEGKVIHRALNQLDFDVQEGEFVAIMGPSGSGKTTLLNLLMATDIPTTGKIVIGGVEPEKLSQNDIALFRRRQIGFVFQEINLLQMLTVELKLKNSMSVTLITVITAT